MQLVIDANIVFAVLIKRGFSLQMLLEMSDKGAELYSPAWLEEELENGKEKLLKYSKLDESKLDFFIETILGKIIVEPLAGYRKYSPAANEIAPHPEDAPYFALALAKACPIWSNEKAFKLQSKVKVLSTHELALMP